MPEPHDCGDPTCDACHPPDTRCQRCGALHPEPAVPFCSPACALAGEEDAREDGAGDPPAPRG